MAVIRRALLTGDDLCVTDVRCGDPPAGWTPLRAADVFGLVLVRDGVVRARVDGVEQTMDPASVYVERLGSEQQFAHPRGADRYTELVPSEPLLASLLGGDPAVPEGLVFTTPAMALRHRLLCAAAGRGPGDAFRAAESAVALAAAALAQLDARRVASGAPATAAARRRLADGAREALAADPRLGLLALAAELGCSPHHLSRVFRAATGATLSRYRNRLRAARALERLAGGERDLGGLAAELGFADQAHMTHVVRAESGLPPGRLRALLAPATGPDGTDAPHPPV
ncbi:helix-turn-helix domain-containing protein [Streptomyces sp. 184]|uniref:helix-turn-helix domain-containing protein n=1 Tax=Streptomyces sp. 184 TaxID=1827526 RepID=UPI003891CE86